MITRQPELETYKDLCVWKYKDVDSMNFNVFLMLKACSLLARIFFSFKNIYKFSRNRYTDESF
jgi:hypothetical protein